MGRARVRVECRDSDTHLRLSNLRGQRWCFGRADPAGTRMYRRHLLRPLGRRVPERRDPGETLASYRSEKTYGLATSADGNEVVSWFGGRAGLGLESQTGRSCSKYVGLRM